MSTGYSQSEMTLVLKAADTLYGNRPSFEYLWPARQFPGVSKFMKRGPKGLATHTGLSVTFSVITDEQNTARIEGYFPEEQTSQVDYPAQSVVPHRRFHNYYQLDTLELKEAAGDQTKLMDIVSVRSAALSVNLTALIEANLMTQPSVASGLTFFPGLFYWMVPCTSTQAGSVGAGAAGAFQGGNPFTRSAAEITAGAGGMPVATFPRWKNYCYDMDENGSMSTSDKKRTLRAIRQTDFEKPPTFKDLENPKWAYALYASQDRLEGIENLITLSNENHGIDVGKYLGATTLMGNPITWVPTWDDTTTYPVYADATYKAASFLIGVNHNTIGFSLLKGCDFSEHFTSPTAVIQRKDVYMTGSLVCRNRQQSGFVGATTATS